MPVQVIQTLSELQQHLSAADRLIILYATASWCGPCKMISPVYDKLSNEFASRDASFLKMDVDQAQDLARQYNISAMPTFKFIRDNEIIDELKGANPSALRQKIQQHARESAPSSAGGSSSSVFGASLKTYIDKSTVMCLNEESKHTFKGMLNGSGHLQSDADEQLLLTIPMQQIVRIKALKITAQSVEQAPKKLKIFVNRFNLGFDEAESEKATQEFHLSADQAKGDAVVELKYVLYQKCQALSIFVESNQGGGDVTRIDKIDLFGESGETVGDMTNLRQKEQD